MISDFFPVSAKDIMTGFRHRALYQIFCRHCRHAMLVCASCNRKAFIKFFCKLHFFVLWTGIFDFDMKCCDFDIVKIQSLNQPRSFFRFAGFRERRQAGKSPAFLPTGGALLPAWRKACAAPAVREKNLKS